MNKGLLSIIGTVFCGSTLLGNFLSQKICAIFVGEVNRAYFPGNDFRVDDVLFREDLQKDSFLNIVNPARNDTFWPDILSKANNLNELLNLISSNACEYKSSWIIEDSKFPDWTDYLVSHQCAPAFQLLLFRSPLAWVRSMIKNTSNAESDGCELLAIRFIDEYIAVYEWHIVNALYYDIPLMPISFEAFSGAPNYYTGAIIRLLDSFYQSTYGSCFDGKFDPELNRFDIKSQAIGGNAKGYLIIKEFQQLLYGKSAESIKEIFSRYSSTSPGQLADISKNFNKFYSIYNFAAVDINIDINILNSKYCVDNARCAKLKMLYDWLMSKNAHVIKGRTFDMLPEFFNPTLCSEDKKFSKVISLGIDSYDSFATKIRSLPDCSVFPRYGFLQNLIGIADSITEGFSKRDRTIAEQASQIQRLRVELLRAEAQLDMLKDLLLGGSDEDRL